MDRDVISTVGAARPLARKLLTGWMTTALLAIGACAKVPPPAARNKDTIAIILGKEIPEKNAPNLRGLILLDLLLQFARENRLEPTAEEVEALEKSRRRHSANAEIRDRLAKELENPDFSSQERERRKAHKALFEKYGGRVIFQQGGPEPIDAMRKFLQEQEKKGSFEILNELYEPDFWKYFTNDAMHRFVPEGVKATLFDTPWWAVENTTK